MNIVQNQKLLTVSKEETGKHTILNIKALEKASRELQGESFKLWIYIAKNQNGYRFALSKQDAITWGIGSKSSYYRAIKELEDKGYLQKKGQSYIFYECPKKNIEI